MLFVCTWFWGDKWPAVYADRLFAGLRRNLRQQFRAVLIADRLIAVGADIVCAIEREDQSLLSQRGCLVRMRMFDASWQASIGARAGDRIVSVDLDVIATAALDPLFDRDDEFTIMQGFNSTNPCPFNGSLWMVRAGVRHDVFEDFSFDAYKSRGVPVHAFPDDQGWLHHKFPNAAAYGPQDGVYAFKKVGWGAAGRRGLPDGARLVAFPGRDPAKYSEAPWVRQHWIGE